MLKNRKMLGIVSLLVMLLTLSVGFVSRAQLGSTQVGKVERDIENLMANIRGSDGLIGAVDELKALGGLNMQNAIRGTEGTITEGMTLVPPFAFPDGVEERLFLLPEVGKPFILAAIDVEQFTLGLDPGSYFLLVKDRQIAVLVDKSGQEHLSFTPSIGSLPHDNSLPVGTIVAGLEEHKDLVDGLVVSRLRLKILMNMVGHQWGVWFHQ